MTANELIQICAGLGIKLTLAGDGSDRLQVDAPKGAITPFLRDALVANKLEVVAALKSQAQTPSEVRTTTPPQTPEKTSLASSVSQIPEVRKGILEQQVSSVDVPVERAELEVKNLIADRTYDAKVVGASDTTTRQIVAAELLAVLSSRTLDQHERARQAFLDHGYFDATTLH